MAEMSSFYGGRQGNSFVIAKCFDGINIPQEEGNNTYTKSFYAVDNSGNFIITTDKTISGTIGVGIDKNTRSTTNFLIKKNKNNYLGNNIPNFGGWKGHANNGDLIIDGQNYIFYPELAQGMVQFFQEGAKTSSEVNYGEYVLIDTILNMNSYNDPDNGKVFLRGMDINSIDGLAGAEYVGQIVGPQGETPELNFGLYDEIISTENYQKNSYGMENTSLIPGSYEDIDNNRNFNDNIQYAWINIRDDFGNTIGSKIGFKIPLLTIDFEATSVSPYSTKNSDGSLSNLIQPDEDSSDGYTSISQDLAIGEKQFLIYNESGNKEGCFVVGEADTDGAFKISFESDGADENKNICYLITQTESNKAIYDNEINEDGEKVYSWFSFSSYDSTENITIRLYSEYWGDDESGRIKEINFPTEFKGWKHPFYQKWKISIPQGYHGINSENIEVIHSRTMSPRYKGRDITLYATTELNENDQNNIVLSYNEENTLDKSYSLYGTSYEYIDDENASNKINHRYYMENGIYYNAENKYHTVYYPTEVANSEGETITILSQLEGKYFAFDENENKYLRGDDFSISDGYYEVQTKDLNIVLIQQNENNQSLGFSWKKFPSNAISFNIGYEDDTEDIEEIEVATFKYAKDEDCYMDILRYKEVDFDEQENGIERYFYIGDYDTISDVVMAGDGTLTFYYTAKEEPLVADQIIRWINDVTLDDTGHFEITFNNGNKTETDLTWVKDVKFEDDGNAKELEVLISPTTGYPYECNAEESYAYGIRDRESKNLFYVIAKTAETENMGVSWDSILLDGTTSIEFEHKDNPSEITTHDLPYVPQETKFCFYYNNGKEERSNSINSVFETCISKTSSDYNNVPDNHLLVWYTSDTLRQTYKNLGYSLYTYPSQRTGDALYGWVDLGPVKGDSGGIKILRAFSAAEDTEDYLPEEITEGIPPEKITDDYSNLLGDSLGCDVHGWCLLNSTTNKLYAFDYSSKKWIPSDLKVPSPKEIIYKTEEVNEIIAKNILLTNGIWLITDSVKYAD